MRRLLAVIREATYIGRLNSGSRADRRKAKRLLDKKKKPAR